MAKKRTNKGGAKKKAAKPAKPKKKAAPPSRTLSAPASRPGARVASAAAAGGAVRGAGAANVAHGWPHESRQPGQIKIGTRYRTDKGDIAALAASINARGGVIQPIAIERDGTLIDGERRLLAWQHPSCRFRGAPIPVHVIDIDSIVAGEYDANAQRKAFSPSELVAIKRALEPKLKAAARERQVEAGRSSRARVASTAPASRAQSAAPAQTSPKKKPPRRAADELAAFAGRDRKTIAKAEEVVAAAEAAPEKFGKLKDDMDRTGNVSGPHRRLKIMQATDALKAAPPALPMRGPYATMAIDYPWPFEGDASQQEIDAAGRSLRPYPAMAIKQGCKFLAEQVAPLLAADCSVYFWVTNHHFVRGYADHLIEALGFRREQRVTILTWVKSKDGVLQIGRGAPFRDASEHCLVLRRGRPLIDGSGAPPPSTVLFGARRENSRKPEEFYRLVERVTPAARYASIFSTGGEGALWDCHGDQVGKHNSSGASVADCARDAGAESAPGEEKSASRAHEARPHPGPPPQAGEGEESAGAELFDERFRRTKTEEAAA